MDYILSAVFVVHILIAVVIFIASVLIGNRLLSRGVKDYIPMTSLAKDDYSGFNTVYRVLFVPIGVVFASIALYQLGMGGYVSDIWLVGVYVLILQLLSIMIMGRWKLVAKMRTIVTQSLAILLTYYLYTIAISKGVAYLLPSEDSIRTELWIIIVLFLYGMFRDMPEGEKDSAHRKHKYWSHKIPKLSEKYRVSLGEYEEDLADILLAVMVYENYNRPKITRILESIVPSKTRYIMQVYGAKSDEDSIRLAAESIEYGYSEYKKIAQDAMWEKEFALREIFKSINPGDDGYGNEVFDIHNYIKTHKR